MRMVGIEILIFQQLSFKNLKDYKGKFTYDFILCIIK
jgi:hypothetical protein